MKRALIYHVGDARGICRMELEGVPGSKEATSFKPLAMMLRVFCAGFSREDHHYEPVFTLSDEPEGAPGPQRVRFSATEKEREEFLKVFHKK